MIIISIYNYYVRIYVTKKIYCATWRAVNSVALCFTGRTKTTHIWVDFPRTVILPLSGYFKKNFAELLWPNLICYALFLLFCGKQDSLSLSQTPHQFTTMHCNAFKINQKWNFSRHFYLRFFFSNIEILKYFWIIDFNKSTYYLSI